MDDLEQLKNAQETIEKLAVGINPLDGEPIDVTNVINDVRIARNLYYASDVLKHVIRRGGIDTSKRSSSRKKGEFKITAEELGQFRFSERPLPLSVIVSRINSLVDLTGMKMLKYKDVVANLELLGLIVTEEKEDGRTRRKPTDLGAMMGISLRQSIGRDGVPFEYMVFDQAAQHYILDNCFN